MPRIHATGETPPVEPRGAVTPPPTFAPARRAVDRRERGVEQLRHVRARRGRLQPPPLIRLVPDEPELHPGVAFRGRCRERGEGGSRGRRPVRGTAAVRPARRPVERHDGRDAMFAERLQHRVRAAPLALAAHLLDLVPVEREADELDAHVVERLDPLVERARPVEEPGVVLEPVTHVRRGVGGRSRRETGSDDGGEQEDPAHLPTVATPWLAACKRVRPDSSSGDDALCSRSCEVGVGGKCWADERSRNMAVGIEQMSETSLDQLGPVDYLVVEFPAGASNFTGEMATELIALVDAGTDPRDRRPDPDQERGRNRRGDGAVRHRRARASSRLSRRSSRSCWPRTTSSSSPLRWSREASPAS